MYYVIWKRRSEIYYWGTFVYACDFGSYWKSFVSFTNIENSRTIYQIHQINMKTFMEQSKNVIDMKNVYIIEQENNYEKNRNIHSSFFSVDSIFVH